VGVLLLNELWNYGFFGLRSTLAGFLGMVVFLALLTALIAVLIRYERFSAGLLVPYYLWVLYDLAWTYELWRLNGATVS
jgi:benzodiazapine receptor